MTNPSFKEIKIGYADNVEKRRNNLNTGAPSDYEVYATYEVKERLQDKGLHRLIDSLDPSLRFNPRKEFYSCTPHKAYELLYYVASISGTLDCLSEENLNNSTQITKSNKKEKFSFSKAHIPVGSTLELKGNKDVKVIVEKDNKIQYKGKLTSLSELAWKFSKRKYMPQGPRFFIYDGELLSDRRNRMEEEGTYK